jgi:hypothetical protein
VYELDCIVCGSKLNASVPGDPATNIPHRANVFRSSGHYGATAFDKLDSLLEINVCTPCLNAAADHQRVYWVLPKRTPPPPPSYKLWNPHEEEIPEWERRLIAEQAMDDQC